jgi:hypothetical protein
MNVQLIVNTVRLVFGMQALIGRESHFTLHAILVADSSEAQVFLSVHHFHVGG